MKVRESDKTGDSTTEFHCRFLARFMALSLSRPFCRIVDCDSGTKRATVRESNNTAKRTRWRQCEKRTEVRQNGHKNGRDGDSEILSHCRSFCRSRAFCRTVVSFPLYPFIPGAVYNYNICLISLLVVASLKLFGHRIFIIR